MVAHSRRRDVRGAGRREGRPAAQADRSAGAVYRLERGAPADRARLVAPRRGLLVRPHRYTPATVIAGWLPRGAVSTEPLKDTIRRVAAIGWAATPGPVDRGLRLRHGPARGLRARGMRRRPTLADAVAASCAIPGFYQPVTIGGRRYVDGGRALDLQPRRARPAGLDLVICLNPTSSLHAPQIRASVSVRPSAAGRPRAGGWAAKRRSCARAGTEVVLIQPTVQDLDVMGPNLMSSKRRRQVIAVAAQTVAAQVRRPELRARLRALPPGEELLVRRPSPAPPEPIDFTRLARARWPATAAAG